MTINNELIMSAVFERRNFRIKLNVRIINRLIDYLRIIAIYNYIKNKDLIFKIILMANC